MATETEWRRRWKPTLAACPWQSVDVDGESLLIKTKFSGKCYEVLITDLTSFWYESLDENALKKRIEKLNPNIEAPVTKVLDQIRQNLEKPGAGTSLSVEFKARKDHHNHGHGEGSGAQQMIVLSIMSTLAGMRFIWNFHAAPADSTMARDHLTVPLLAMVSELFRQQRELTTILAAKDKEIDDYKSQGVRASRKHIETTRFDSIAFKNTMVTSKAFEQQVKNLETATFDSDGQELYRQIVTKHAWLTHQHSGDGDEEDMSDEEESIPMSGAVGQSASSTKQSWASRLPPSLVPSKGASPTKTPTGSPRKSPAGKSPTKSPGSHSSTSDSTPTKDTEKLRREALERKLEQEEQKKQDKKKKKKLAF